MNLQPVELRPDQRLLCSKCGNWCGGKHKYMAQPEKVFADLDGEPFVSYYCQSCKPEAP